MTAPLVVDGLHAAWGSQPVLQDISFTAEDGSITLVAGPNGAGKSTLLSVLSGTLAPSAGTVLLDGTPPHGGPGGKVSSVPEGRKLFPSLTILENLRIAAHVWHIPGAERDRRIERAWQRFPALADARRRPVRTLSGGQQQQLTIARALLAEPRLLVLDEPSIGLAPIAWTIVADACRSAAAEGTIVVVSEQRLHLAEGLADRCLLITGGRLTFDGPTDALDTSSFDRDYFGLDDT